jgi:hypothetical protein
MSLIVCSFAIASMRERLAWVAACQYVDGFDRGPVDLFHIPKIDDSWVVVRKDCAGRLVVFAMPDDLPTNG